MTVGRPLLSGSIHPSPRRLVGLLTAAAAVLALGVLQNRGQSAAPAPTGAERLTSRSRAPEPKVAPVAVGTEIETGAGQQRRLVLPGGSVLYVNQDTKVKVDTPRKVILSAGEIYVEPAPTKKTGVSFAIGTPEREVTGQGAFAVRTGKSGTSVVVAQGHARIEGVPAIVSAGQRLTPASNKPVPAPRVSHLLAWARDAMIAAELPLVPGSKHAGGALIAVDPDGQEASLSLRKYHVDVHVEEGFARTTIDQTYFNHQHSRLEGTFYFPLPADASLSRLAMYVDGKLMEGGMVERDYARQVYETILYQQRDPALLEWVDGSTFKMRVFPLEPRQEKRIILSYTQKLPSLYGQAQYRFPAGHSLQTVRDWSFHARIKNGAERPWNSSSHSLKAVKDENDMLLDAAAKNARLDKDVQLTLTDPRPQQGETTRFSMADRNDARYLMLRYRPQIENRKPKIGNRKDWVFLFESTGDRDPLLARVQIEIIRHLLGYAGSDDSFAVLTAGTRVRSYANESLPVTPENVQSAIAFLEGAHLIGALDLEKALKEAKGFLKVAGNPYLVHLGSGIPALGERKQQELARLIPEGTRYVGVGVGRLWSRAMMKATADKTGGYFTQINPDEPIGWRSFELAATLSTPRLLNVAVADPDGKASFLTMTSDLAQGEELCAICRLHTNKFDVNPPLPKSIVITGTIDGEPFEQTLPVKQVAEKADYLPRTWASLEIDRLLTEDAVKNKPRIVGLSKAMYVMTPYTSLLVLENEDMYQQYKVDRGRQDHWAMYPCPKKIEVVREDDEKPRNGRKTVKQAFDTILMRDRPRFLKVANENAGERKPARVGQIMIVGNTVSRNSLPELGLVTIKADDEQHVEKALGVSRIRARSLPNPRLSLQQLPSADGSTAGFWGIGIDQQIKSFQGRRGEMENYDIEALNSTDKLGPFQQAAFPSPYGLPILSKATIPGHDEKINPREEDDSKIDAALLPRVKYPNSLVMGATVYPVADLGIPIPSKPDVESSFLYQRPTFSGDERFFYDLVAYCPGLNTDAADFRAVLDAEAWPVPRVPTSVVSAEAKKLIDKARSSGWQALTIPAAESRPAFTIVFDGQGRFTYERILPPGLRERVICDGKTLVHLYPDLGLGARRTVSRFHRQSFATMIPWLVLAAEDLAREGNEVRLVDTRTVRIRPLGAPARKDAKGKPVPYAELHLVFGDEGQLVERKLLSMPENKIVYREVLSPTGTITFLGKDGKELAARKWRLEPAKLPSLEADTSGLVVLPMPYRTREHVLETLKIKGKPYQQLRFTDALQLLAADFAAGNGSEMLQVFQQAFHGRDQRQLGYHVLLAACGQNLDAEHADVMSEHEEEPVARYLALHSSPLLRKHASQWAVGSKQWSGFLEHLAITHALYQRWQNDNITKGTAAKRKAEQERALAYVRQNKGTVWGWGLLCLLEDRAGKDKDFHKQLAEVCPLFADLPGLGYPARYEQARSLWKAGLKNEARRQFVALYEKSLQEDVLPELDADFRAALLGDGALANLWSELLRKTAARLIAKKRRPAVLALAWQCWQLEDRPLANHLVTTALEGAPEKDRVPMTLAVLGFYQSTGQLDRADGLLQQLASVPRLAASGGFWRLGLQLAESRDMPVRALDCLERALEGEYRSLPEVIDLKQVRADYTKLLDHYQRLADAMVALQIKPKPEFLAKVVRAADRWRALDREGAASCKLAGRILNTLGDREMSWDYLTTPVGLKPNESQPWLDLARTMSRQGDLDLADRAYVAAFSAEPTNAQILWDRAESLRQSGRTVAARKLFRQIADGKWQPRFQGLKDEAALQQ